MKIHTVIIDDEINGVRTLELMLEQFAPEVKVVATSTSARKGVDIINDYRPELVFLDINMPELNGFELLELLEHKNFFLIFSTAHQEYALRALKINASDYLLKPIVLEDLLSSIEKVKAQMSQNVKIPDIYGVLAGLMEVRNMRIVLPSKTNLEYVSPSDIVYIEADSNASLVMLRSGNLVKASCSLKDYEEQLCSKPLFFMRIHHSFIVNLHYVTRYVKEDGGYVVIQGKKSIPISKQRKSEFLQYFDLKE